MRGARARRWTRYLCWGEAPSAVDGSLPPQAAAAARPSLRGARGESDRRRRRSRLRKTALVAKFLQELDGDSVWYSLDAADRDPLLFFRYLVQGIREQSADFGERSEEAFAELRPSAAELDRLADVFVSEAEEILGGRLTVVLDGSITSRRAPRACRRCGG
jgi:hypothetical protein